jgi:hypothetical protein
MVRLEYFIDVSTSFNAGSTTCRMVWAKRRRHFSLGAGRSWRFGEYRCMILLSVKYVVFVHIELIALFSPNLQLV